MHHLECALSSATILRAAKLAAPSLVVDSRPFYGNGGEKDIPRSLNPAFRDPPEIESEPPKGAATPTLKYTTVNNLIKSEQCIILIVQ